MSCKVMLVATLAKQVPVFKDCDYIGIDRGALIAIRQGIQLQCAIGDFDSINEEEKEEVTRHCPIEELPFHKDETDTEQGIFYALQQGYDDIILYGGIGGRLDHTLANLYLLMNRDLPLTLMDEHHEIKVLKKGIYQIPKRFTYLSFLALEDSQITETGVAYPLYERSINTKDIYPISNEILQNHADVTIHYGRVLMIQCEDEQHPW